MKGKIACIKDDMKKEFFLIRGLRQKDTKEIETE